MVAVSVPSHIITKPAYPVREAPTGPAITSRTPQPAPARKADRAALAEAVDMLELQNPVRVEYTRGRRTAGRYTGLHDGWHVIRVSTDFGHERMGRTLWHELTHARQCEDFADFRTFIRAYEVFSSTNAKAARGGTSKRYQANPYERAARLAEEWNDALPLVVVV